MISYIYTYYIYIYIYMHTYIHIVKWLAARWLGIPRLLMYLVHSWFMYMYLYMYNIYIYIHIHYYYYHYHHYYYYYYYYYMHYPLQHQRPRGPRKWAPGVFATLTGLLASDGFSQFSYVGFYSVRAMKLCSEFSCAKRYGFECNFCFALLTKRLLPKLQNCTV